MDLHVSADGFVGFIHVALHHHLDTVEQEDNPEKIPSQVSLLSSVFIGFLCLFFLLLFLKVDDYFDLYWGVVFVPFWVCLTLYAVFMKLITPQLLESSLHREFTFLLLYGLAALYTSITLVNYLDTGSPEIYVVLGPLCLLSVAEIISYIIAVKKIKNDNSFYRKKPLEFIFVTTVFDATSLIITKYTVLESPPDFLMYLVVLKSFIIWFAGKEVFNYLEANRGYKEIK